MRFFTKSDAAYIAHLEESLKRAEAQIQSFIAANAELRERNRQLNDNNCSLVESLTKLTEQKITAQTPNPPLLPTVETVARSLKMPVELAQQIDWDRTGIQVRQS